MIFGITGVHSNENFQLENIHFKNYIILYYDFDFLVSQFQVFIFILMHLVDTTKTGIYY
jgi:hypothetical protein